MTFLDIILVVAAALGTVGVVAVLVWLGYTTYLTRLERRLSARKGLYRDLVAALATRDRALLEPVIHQGSTLRDFEALEAVLEEQARGLTERPDWLLDAYDRLGLVTKYINRLRDAKKWRERAFAAELLGRVGNAAAVPTLLETVQATRAEDADVREIALRALARIADPRAVTPLAEALKKAEVWLAPRIADILARHGDMVVEPMIAFLEEPSQHPARAWAANILGEVRATRAFPALVRALDDLDDEVRAKAAASLGKLGDHRAVTYLLDHLLTDPAPFVRARIAGALGQFNDTEVIDTLVRALGDPAWWVRMRSVEALEQIGAVSEGPLMLALDDTDPEIRIRAAVALERLGVPNRIIGQIESGTASGEAMEILTKFGLAGARELLAEQLAHSSPLVRMTIISAIQQAGRRDLSNELIHSSLEDPDPEIRAAAFDALRNLGVKDAVASALNGLGDENQHVRTSAMQLIGELGEAEVANMIRPRTADYEPMVRAAAARALGQIQAKDAQPELARLLRDPVPEVRAAAADGVADGGGSWAVPELLKLLVDADPAARRSAAHALGRVGGPSILPALTRAFQSGAPDLREVIAEAVAQIDIEALPPLLDMLMESRDLQARLATVRILSSTRSPKAAELLEVVWKDPEPEVRTLVAEALGQQPGDRSVRLLREGLADADEHVRARAVEALAFFGSLEAGPDILALLETDPSPKVRERAALATGLLRVPGGEAALLAACASQEPLNVRAAAALGLGAFDQESIVAQVLRMPDEDQVREFLRDRLQHDPGFRQIRQRLKDAQQVELRALGSLNREQMEASLVEGMRGVLDPRERVRLVSAIRAFEGERSRRVLAYAVRSDPSPEVRASALNAVAGMLDQEELFLSARRAVSDPHPVVRRVAVTLFSRMIPEQALPMLIRLLRTEDEDPVVLETVARHAERAFDIFVSLTQGLAPGSHENVTIARVARYINHPELPRLLASIGQSEVPEARRELALLWGHRPELMTENELSRLSADPVPDVRLAAVLAWSAARRFDRLAQFFEDPDPAVRRRAALELRSASDGPDPSRLLNDPDETVRAGAWSAQMLRGQRADLPGNVGRETAAAAIREVMPIDDLHTMVRTNPDPRKRLSAALALALLDDPLAHEVAQNDPEPEVRQYVSRMLNAGRNPV
ncbi:MAG: HEAT repeat domain-containing protein [Gemmatimonadota bacterium]